MFDRGANGNAIELVLQWLDLASHFRLRESSAFYRDEVPRHTKALIVRGCESARRCHEKIFTPDKTRLHSISLDLSRSAPSSPSSPSSFSSSPSNLVGHGVRSIGGSSGGTGGGSARGRGGLHVNISVAGTLPRLVREHRPVELRVHNMLRGGEFSAALLALEESVETVRRDLCVLQLGLATGGPRPYQDPRFHHWCMLRLMLVLGGAKAAAVAVGGKEGEREGKLVEELAGLSGELTATAGYLVGGGGFALEAEGSASAPRGTGGRRDVPVVRARWPRLRELRLSCGITGGDLEGLAECVASMPALEVLEFEGHSFRAPPTDLVAFADALWSASKEPSYRPRLTTLRLKNFKVEGVEGLSALGRALSAERFPSLSALSFSSCRLGDDQLRVLAAAFAGMSRTLKTLDLRSNYALSVGGMTALAEALEAGCVFRGRAPRPGSSSSSNSSSSGSSSNSSSSSNNSNNNSSSSDLCQGARKNNPHGIDQCDGGSGGASPCHASGNACTTSTRTPTSGSSMSSTATHERAPAWSIPTPAPRPPSSASTDRRRTPTPVPPPPLLIESLDLSYSCLWRRARCTPQPLKPMPPFHRLLRALGNGACPRLRYFSLAGCYLGDSEVAQLVAALESGCRALRVLDITDNLFGQAGMKLLLVALLSGRVPPHLRVILSTSLEHPLPEVRAGMALEDVNIPVQAWLRNHVAHPNYPGIRR